MAPPVPAPAAAAMRPAGFWIRVLASIVDSLILGAILTVIVAPVWFLIARGAASEPGRLVLAATVTNVIGGVVSLGYILFFWTRKGATPGKSVLGLRIVRENGAPRLGIGKALLRIVGYFLSSLTLGVGYLMVGFTRDKRGLHDMVAGTRVVRG